GKIEIVADQAKFSVAILDMQIAGVERVAILLTENGEQYLSMQIGVDRIPVDVEIFRDRGGWPVGKHVAPPPVPLRMRAHMVGNEVDDQTHAASVQGVDQRLERFFAAQLRTDAGKVAGIVSA